MDRLSNINHNQAERNHRPHSRTCLMLERLPDIHPGEVLLEEFLKPMKISAYRFSKETGIPPARIYRLIKGASRITEDVARKLSKYFNTSPEFWLRLQDDFDLEEAMRINTAVSGRILKPFTKKELIKRALTSDNDYEKGSFRSQKKLEEDSEKW